MTTTAAAHLWEIDHPYYGPDGRGGTYRFDSFAELREAADELDEDMNHIYRWDWLDYSQPCHDDLFLPGEDRSSEQLFKVFLVLPRKSAFLSWECLISHDQEAEVLAWLRGPRVLGALRTLWSPLLEAEEVAR